MVIHSLELPDYREQAPEVAARFKTIQERPVVLRVANLRKEFGANGSRHVVFDNVSVDIHRREFFTIIGPSGCGKSTFIRVVAGLEDASGGEITLDGKPIHGPGPDRGMVFQGYTLFPWRTVKQNVMFGLELGGKDSSTAEVEARQWLDMVGLSKVEDSYPHELSGGMKQRVAIARALANGPRILIMDEPFGALDAQTRCKMQSYLLQIWRKVDARRVLHTHRVSRARATTRARRRPPMFRRFILGLMVAMMTAPTLYAGAFPFSSSSGIPWETISQAAAAVICRNFGICFASIP